MNLTSVTNISIKINNINMKYYFQLQNDTRRMYRYIEDTGHIPAIELNLRTFSKQD